MRSAIDIYLRDELVISGDLAHYGDDRPLDVLNNGLERFLVLDTASARSLRGEGVPTPLGRARIDKAHVLLAIPHDRARVAAVFRGAYVEKQQLEVTLGLEGLCVVGLLHHDRSVPFSLDQWLATTRGPAFRPVTEATVRRLATPNWAIEAATVLVQRAAISYAGQLAGLSEPPLHRAAPADEDAAAEDPVSTGGDADLAPGALRRRASVDALRGWQTRKTTP